MKTFTTSRKAACVLALVALSIVGLASFIRTSRAHVQLEPLSPGAAGNAAHAQAINITVTNNTSGDIKHLFLSAPDSDNWSADQLNDSAIAAGQSFTINNASCDQQSVRVIAEDPNGCFIYQTVSCAGDASWAIPNNAPRDCGN